MNNYVTQDLGSDKSFYIKSMDNFCITNPDYASDSDYFVWDPHGWWEFNYALNSGIEFFPKAEIYRSNVPPNDAVLNTSSEKTRRKIALLFYEDVYRPWTQPSISKDQSTASIKDLHLGWADLVIIYSSEQMKDWWPVVYGEMSRQLHTDKIVLMFNGYNNYTDPDPNFIFVNHHSFLSYVASGNTYQDMSATTVPFRKYMFDCLIGTVKYQRLGLFYRLLDSEFLAQTLVNLQPNPHLDINWNHVQSLYPDSYNKYGAIDDYSSKDLIDLEEDVVKEAKLLTQNLSAQERYSTNQIARPGFDLPGNRLMISNVVPWKIYQSSWYSIVCETTDDGASNLFVTEKLGKCLFAKRIFVLLAGKGILKYLRSLGFRTFHGSIIDESYDDEPNDQLRLEMVWKQIDRLYRTDPRQVYAEFQEVLDHNHNLMNTWTSNQLTDIQEFLHKRLDYVCSRANDKST